MKTPRWADRRVIDILHAESLSEHGGLEGVRDAGMLELALMRPVNLHLYDPEAVIVRLAAAYGFGLARNHPFADGNKRAAFIAAGLFLGCNGYMLVADKIDAYRTIIKLADGSLSEEEFADWLRENTKRRGRAKRAVKKAPLKKKAKAKRK